MKKDIVIAAVVVVVVVALTWGLASMRPDFVPTASKPFSPEPKAAEGGSDKVILRINGEAITESEFNQFLTEAPAEQRDMYKTPQGRRLLADELIKLKALEQEGRKMGVEKDPEVKAQLEMLEAQLIAGKALQKLIGTPDEKVLRAEYDKAKAEFETVNLGHIVVAYAGGAVPPRSGQAPPIEIAMEKANGIAQRLRQGAVFEQIARTESDDSQTGQAGGTLGDVPIGMLPPDIGPAVKNLKPGEISNPVRTQFGVHVFRAGQRGSRSFEELKPMLEDKAKRAKLDETIKNLIASAKVDLDPRFFPPAAKPGEPAAAPAEKQ
ncbi:MAG: peptidylprolyl isomerase [Thermoanaerobaculia bacterium]